MHRHLIPLFVLLILSPATILAQPADMPTPQQLFDAARAAMGDPAEGVGSIEAHARVDVTDPGGNYSYRTAVKGNWSTEALGDASFTMIKDGDEVTYGETDGNIWFEGKDGSRRDLVAGMAKFVRGHQFHRRVLAPELEFMTINPQVLEDEFSQQPVFVVEGTTHAGAQLRYYYHRRTKMPVGMHLVVPTDTGPHAMDFTMKDWRSSAGKQLFWRIDIADRGKLFAYHFDRILLLP